MNAWFNMASSFLKQATNIYIYIYIYEKIQILRDIYAK